MQGFRLDTKARTLSAGEAEVNAGLGPTSLAVRNRRAYVTDKIQNALLIFELRPELHLQRRVFVEDGPRKVVVRGDRLVVTTAHDSVELTADGAARRLTK